MKRKVEVTDKKSSKHTSLRVPEVGPTHTHRSAKHNAVQFDAPGLKQGEPRKFHVHDGHGGHQRAPSPATSKEILFKESFYAESFDDLPGDDKNLLIGFKRTGEDPSRRASSTETEATTIRSSIDSATAQEVAEEASRLLPRSPNSQGKLGVIPPDATGGKVSKGAIESQDRGFEAMPERPQKRRKTERPRKRRKMAHGSKAQPRYK